MGSCLPSQLVAGDTWTLTFAAYADYDATLWTLNLHLRGSGGSLDAVATYGDSGYVFSIPPADTGKLNAGSYGWQLRLANGTDRVETARGTVDVLADLEGSTDFDGRSWVKRMLDAIRANLEGIASREEQEYTVTSGGGGGRTLRLMSRKELLDLEGEFTARYRREQIEAGQLPASTNQVRARFC